MAVQKKEFGALANGEQAFLYTITNQKGESVSLTDYGASVVSLLVKDREGVLRDIVLGCDNAAVYEQQTACLGGVPGRHANRIAAGRFVLNGKTYTLEQNNGENHLHGGSHGFHRRLWQGYADGEDSVVFSRWSPDGEEGYPGNLVVSVRYTFDDHSRLVIRYRAICDQDTVLNLTNHAYFNLDGHDSGSVESQRLKIHADAFTENDSGCLPTGRIVSLDSEEGAPLDFRRWKEIGKDLHQDNLHLKNGSGYDHNYILRPRKDKPCALAYSPNSGIRLECRTTQPGLQLYTGNFLEESNIVGKGGAVYHNRDGFCLETQHFPNAMEHPEFPSVVLRAGAVYREKTEYRFRCK